MVTTLKVSFSARGSGMMRIYSFGEKSLKPVEVTLDSKEWKRYAVDLPLCGTHPRTLVFRFMSNGNDPIDLDDVEIAAPTLCPEYSGQ